jgi:hypothetical protein
MTESKLRLRLSLPLEPHHLSVTTLSWPGMPTLLLAWALLLALARAAPLFQAEQAVLTASLHSIDTASTTTPRPDRTAYFDPRAGGGAQYNVSDSVYRSEPFLRRSQQAYRLAC